MNREDPHDRALDADLKPNSATTPPKTRINRRAIPRRRNADHMVRYDGRQRRWRKRSGRNQTPKRRAPKGGEEEEEEEEEEKEKEEEEEEEDKERPKKRCIEGLLCTSPRSPSLTCFLVTGSMIPTSTINGTLRWRPGGSVTGSSYVNVGAWGVHRRGTLHVRGKSEAVTLP